MPPSATRLRLLTVALATWAVGVQLSELVAAVGCYGTAAVVLTLERPTLADVKRWWPLALFIGWGLIVPLLGGHAPTGSGVARLCDWLLLPVAAWAAAQLGERCRPVLIAAAVTCALSCLAAALQYFGLWPPLEFFEGLPALKVPFERVYEPTADGHFMAGGLLFHRLKFAHVTALVVLAAASRWREPRAAALALFGFVSVAVFPAARAAAGALALAMSTLVKPRWVAVALIAVVAAAGLWSRSPGERVELLRGGLAAVEQHPLTGVGLGRFKPVDFSSSDNQGKAHNQALSIAAEGGIVHGLLFVALLVWLGRLLFKANATAGLAALAFFALIAQLHDPLFHPVFAQALMLVLGGALGLSSRSAGEATSRRSRAS
ncbi:MAG: O-antigen ligase family protein [Archangiaceae bacterium]|nr:O-antigen ligase family protein [Archangiaceae bacterium]